MNILINFNLFLINENLTVDMNQSNEQISIIIAAYNEQGNIEKAIKKVRDVLPQAEIIVVDDGSTDQTLHEAQQFEDKLIKIIINPKNMGKGNAIRKGIETATSSIMAQVDADLQFPAEGLPNLINPILKGEADIVFGSRYLNPSLIENDSVSFVKQMASYVVAKIVSLICGQDYTDVFAGFKAWRSDIIRNLDLKEDGFTYEAEIAIKAKRKNYKVIEIPTAYKKRTTGQSKIKLIYHTIHVSYRIFKLALFS